MADYGPQLAEFQHEMFLEMLENDGVTVLARGLGSEALIHNFLKVHNHEAELVLVIGMSSEQQSLHSGMLRLSGLNPPPRIITADSSVATRHEEYLKGGILFITSRILVVDMLMKRLPTHLVTGILVGNAHKVEQRTTEAFILRLYRFENRAGFIKAVTDSPENLVTGFFQIDKILKALWLRKINIWPRFQKTIINSLADSQPEVVEVRITLTKLMEAVQFAIRDLMVACLQELKKARPALELQHLTADRILFDGFGQLLKSQLDPVWDVLSSQTKQLYTDIRTLQTLVYRLHRDDCVSFYHYLMILRASSHAFNQHSLWLFLNASEDLLVNAKLRVFADKTTEDCVQFEAHPKWLKLKELLGEIKMDGKMPGRTVIIVDDDHTRRQLEHFLREGAECVLANRFKRYQAWRVNEKKLNSIVLQKNRQGSLQQPKGRAKRRKIKEEREKVTSQVPEVNAKDVIITDDAFLDSAVKSEAKDTFLPGNAENNTEFHKYYSMMSSDSCIALYPLTTESGSGNRVGLSNFLANFRPSNIIMYTPCLATMRQIEVFSSFARQRLNVYFMLYDGSLEEQKYLTTVRREKEAFEKLIFHKQNSAVENDQDGRLGHRQEQERAKHCPVATSLSSRDARQAQTGLKIVLVDMREFRSSLPSHVHEHGMVKECGLLLACFSIIYFKDLVPITLSIGDYILSPNMCVERKSIPDLIGSLNSGRLLTQVESMTKYYDVPILLIEFDPDKPFTFLDELSGDIEYKSTMSKIVLLVKSFPKLRILWARSAAATAALFLDLKQHERQPDAGIAVSFDAGNIDAVEDGYASGPKAFLSKLPGVRPQNITRILDTVPDLLALSKISLQSLQEMMGVSDGKILHDFLYILRPSSNGYSLCGTCMDFLLSIPKSPRGVRSFSYA
eukprot:m.224674 g.224674  ORF g.224674 m.224674 type:complete len:904 (+) comp15951_c0_seq21:138-2849(+)